jgi:haloacetate dehalogenase
MSISKKYFPEFKKELIDVGNGIEINTLYAKNGEDAILFLHGHPESYLIWRDIAPVLAKNYSIVVTDLRGYGESSKPEGLEDHSNYSKRVMAQDQIKVMEKLGFKKFHLVGHDRGARVAHRLILDYKERVSSCTLMDILPTYDMYEKTNREFATKYWHWFFYIQPKPFAETFLGSNPEFFIRTNLLKKASKDTVKKMFPDDILDEYIKHYSNEACVHAISEDYRASNSIDLEHDKLDRQNTITTPLLVLWGENGVVGNIWNVLEGWKEFANDVSGFAVPNCGHFVPEEQPIIVLEALNEFLEKNGKKK